MLVLWCCCALLTVNCHLRQQSNKNKIDNEAIAVFFLFVCSFHTHLLDDLLRGQEEREVPAGVSDAGGRVEEAQAQVLVLAQLRDALHAVPRTVADLVQLVPPHHLVKENEMERKMC